MFWTAAGAIADLIAALGVIVTLVFVARQLREQITQSQSTAYYGALDLMITHWDKMNLILDPKFHPYEKWRDEEKRQADEVCLILHQLGAAVEKGAVPIDICDVYFYTIPTIREKLDRHITARRNPKHDDYRSNKYYWAFDELADKVRKRNKLAGRKIRAHDV